MIEPESLDLDKLLTDWYGQKKRSELSGSIRLAGLPSALRNWYRVASCWPRLESALCRVYEPQEIRTVQGKVEFMADATGDWFWSFDEEHPDRVYETELHGEWTLVPESLSDFVTHLSLSAAAASPNYSRSARSSPVMLYRRCSRALRRWGLVAGGGRAQVVAYL